ncbi:MAG: Stealth CR1 domain-containing protein [Deferrisomatales bacterium]|nr:Stealth CR1 domain-containing protein [Deferrisomatales bacterium]
MNEIDVVYTWVDGSDPRWRAKREFVLRGSSGIEARRGGDTGEHCFSDNAELKFSLRSLECHAPWVRRVYLVTDAQVPRWLNQEEVHVVDHTDVFPSPDLLPSFSSHAIELCLHRIDGLADQFVGFNDDFFLGRRIHPEDFYSSGKPIVRVVRMGRKRLSRFHAADAERMTPHQAAVARSRHLIYERFGVLLPYKVRHYPRAMTRRGLQAVWDLFPSEIRTTLGNPFRTVEDVAIHELYAHHVIAVNGGHLRVLNGVAGFLSMLRMRMDYMGTSVGDRNFQRKLNLIRRIRPMFFSINDKPEASVAERGYASSVLSGMFPHRCKYELA